MNEIIEPGTAVAVEAMTPAMPSVAMSPTMLMISQAVAGGASIEMVERLMAMQDKMEANEARKAFVAAMAEFKAADLTIDKNKHVEFTSRDGSGKTEYNHATLDNVCATVGPHLSRVGLSYRWKTDQLDGGLIRVTCIVRHALGHFEETALQAGRDDSGKKNNIQQLGSTVSYLQRYTLMSALGLASGDPDDDGRSSEDNCIGMDQITQIQEGLTKANADIAAFCKYFKVNALAEIKQKDVGRVWEMIHAKRAKADLDHQKAGAK